MFVGGVSGAWWASRYPRTTGWSSVGFVKIKMAIRLVRIGAACSESGGSQRGNRLLIGQVSVGRLEQVLELLSE
jgi:hypothetical protein